MTSVPLPAPLQVARQLLRVLAPGWADSSGQLQRFVRPAPGATWQPLGAPIPVSLGRNGLAWGIGLHPPLGLPGPIKHEGDGCAPAGLFALPRLFGQAEAAAPLDRPARMPYLGANRHLYCVDDPASRHYNQIVDERQVSRDWQSAEEMQRQDERYAIGAVIAHNPENVPGAGSCIFLHVHAGPGQPTAGCTAGAREHIETLCAWLDAAATPLLLQLPADIYADLSPAWHLPA